MQNIIDCLTNDEIKKILDDLDNTFKKHHWMWWAFPIKDDTIYSISHQDALLLLSDFRFYSYYLQALEKISKKDSDFLFLYFGEIDFQKLKSHFKIFLNAAIKLRLNEIIQLQKEIVNKIDIHESSKLVIRNSHPLCNDIIKK